MWVAHVQLPNWLFARHCGGKLILRVEDTDQARSTLEHEKMQIEDIKWLGLDYDEGPDVGGPYGPYRQSERLAIYKKYGDELVSGGKAYPCFCSEEVLEQKREIAMKAGGAPQYDEDSATDFSKQDVEQKFTQWVASDDSF